MDMNDLQHAIPTTLNYPNLSFTFANPRHQIFPFRWPIIKYILKNPTGKTWMKLIKICKFFFAKHPVYPVRQLKYNHDQWEGDGEKINLSKLIRKLWIFYTFDCCDFSVESNAVSKFIPKVFKFDIRTLCCYQQALTWENYQILTSAGFCEDLAFYGCSIKYSDGSDVTLDKLLENLQNVDMFHFVCKVGTKVFKKDTVTKMAKILSRFKYMFLRLLNLDESFDLSSFMDFFLKTSSVLLHYNNDLLFSDDYKQMLEKCFEQFVTTTPEDMPEIRISGFDGLHYQEYRKLADRNNSI